MASASPGHGTLLNIKGTSNPGIKSESQVGLKHTSTSEKNIHRLNENKVLKFNMIMYLNMQMMV